MANKYRLLVMLKPEEEQPAVERAEQYARISSEVEVVALRVINEFNEENKEQLLASAKRDFERLQKRYSNSENMTLKVVFDKDVPDAFIKESDSGEYNLAIISANKRNTIKDLFISTIDSSIMRKCRIPLVVVKDAKTAVTLGKAIILAVDFSEKEHLNELDEYLFKVTKIFSDTFNGEIHLASCISPLNRGLMSGDTGLSKILSGTTIDPKNIYARIALDFAQKHEIPIEQVHVLEGRIDEELPRLCAQLSARMVCMGTTPRSSFFGAIDSIASELVLEQIKGDVFVVNSDHLNV